MTRHRRGLSGCRGLGSLSASQRVGRAISTFAGLGPILSAATLEWRPTQTDPSLANSGLPFWGCHNELVLRHPVDRCSRDPMGIITDFGHAGSDQRGAQNGDSDR